MNRKFLEDLGIDKEVVDKILDEASKDIGKEKAKTEQAKNDLTEVQTKLDNLSKELENVKKSAGDAETIKGQLDALQKKYDTETEQYKAQIAERDYSDAVAHEIAEAGVKFSSKAAERAFISELKAKKLEVKDGKLVGFTDFHKEQVKSDPTAFQTENKDPKFADKVGAGGPPATESKGAMYAKKFNQQYETSKKE